MRVLLFSRTPQTGVVDHSFLSERHERSNGHGIAQETDRLNGGTGSVLFLLHYDGQGVAPTGQVLSWSRKEERQKPLVFRPCGECHCYPARGFGEGAKAGRMMVRHWSSSSTGTGLCFSVSPHRPALCSAVVQT